MTNNWLHKSTRLHFQVHSWPQFAIYRFWQKFTVQKKEKRKPSVVFCKICELGVSIIQDGPWQKNIATFLAGLQSLLLPKVTEITVHSIIPVYWANLNILFIPISMSTFHFGSILFLALPPMEVANWPSMCYYRLTVFI